MLIFLRIRFRFFSIKVEGLPSDRLRERSFGIFQNKNIFRNVFRLFCSFEQNSRNENSSQTNAYSHYSNYSYSGLIPKERILRNSMYENKLTIASRQPELEKIETVRLPAFQSFKLEET